MPFERNPELAAPDIRVMWKEGPSRYWSDTRRSGATHPYDTGGFVGNYVCQACALPVVGVYEVKAYGQVATQWICAACVTARKPKKEVKA